MINIVKQIVISLFLVTRGILSLDRVFETLSQKVTERLGSLKRSDLAAISCAASLAQRGLLDGDVKSLALHDVDLTSVPGKHLASLASSVTQYLDHAAARRVWPGR